MHVSGLNVRFGETLSVKADRAAEWYLTVRLSGRYILVSLRVLWCCVQVLSGDLGGTLDRAYGVVNTAGRDLARTVITNVLDDGL